jgi:hypothetical protein
MKTAFVLCLVLWGSACSTSEQSAPSGFAINPPVPHDWIAEVKAVARTRRMRYVIFCTDWQSDSNYQFQAMLCTGPCGSAIDHDLDDMTWQAGHGATQAEAAHDLLDVIADRGWYTPEPKPKVPKPMIPKKCPPQIEGEYFALNP